MVLFINPGGGTSKFPNGDSFAVFSSNTEIAIFGSLTESSACVRLCDSTSAYGNTIRTRNETLAFTSGSNNTEMVTMTTSNNVISVGINQTSPNINYSLDVNGNLNIQNGMLYVNGNKIINNVYAKTIATLDVSMVASSFYVGDMDVSGSSSLYVPTGNGIFSGNGEFGGDGTFGGKLTAQQLQTNELKMNNSSITYDNGLTDKSYVIQTSTSTPSANVNSFVNHIYTLNGVVYSMCYNPNTYTITIYIQQESLLTHFSIQDSMLPVFYVGTNGIIIAGKRYSLSYGSMHFNLSTTTSDYAASLYTFNNGDGFVMSYSLSGVFQWINRLSVGLPTDAICASDGTVAVISGTYNTPTPFIIQYSVSNHTDYPLITGLGAFMITFLMSSGMATSCQHFSGPIQNPTLSLDVQDNIIWGGSFSNIISCPSYPIYTSNFSTCNIEFSANLSPIIINGVDGPVATGSNLNIISTSNMLTYNTYTSNLLSISLGTSSNSTPFDYLTETMPVIQPLTFYNARYYVPVYTPFTLTNFRLGYSNVFITKQNTAGDMKWLHQLSGNGLVISKVISNNKLNSSYALLTVNDSQIHKVASYSFIGLSNTSVSNSEQSGTNINVNTTVSPTTVVLAYSTLFSGTNMWFTSSNPTDSSSIITSSHNNETFLITAGQTIYQYDSETGNNVLTYKPYHYNTNKQIASLLSATIDQTYGNFIIHGTSIYADKLNLYFNDQTVLGSCAYGTYTLSVPSYILPTASVQITQSNINVPSLQIVQTGLGPVQRIISTNLVNNLVEGYSKNDQVFSISPYGNMTIQNVDNIGGISTDTMFIQTKLVSSNQTYNHSLNACNVNVIQSMTTSNMSTNFFSCRQFCVDATVGSNSSIYSWATTKMYSPLTVYNNVQLGGTNAQTVQITSNSVNINNNLYVSSNINTSNISLYSASINKGNIRQLALSDTLILGNNIFLNTNYNSTSSPFVGIGASTPYPSNMLLTVNGSASFKDIYCTNGITIGTSNISNFGSPPFFQTLFDSKVIIIGLTSTMPTFPGPSSSYVFNNGMNVNNLLSSVSIRIGYLSLFVTNSSIFADVYASSSLTTPSFCSTSTVGICTNPNPNYSLDILGTCRATLFNGIGSNITQVNATNITAGTIGVAYLPSVIAQISSGIGAFKSICTIGSNAISDTKNALIVDGNVKISNSSSAITSIVIGQNWNATSNTAQIGKLDSDGQWTNGAYMQICDSSNINSVNNGTSLKFYTYNYTSNTTQESLHIAANGYVGIGRSEPTKSIDVSGDIVANTVYGYLVGDVSGNATSANKVNYPLTSGTHLSLTAFDGSVARTITTDATSANTGSTIVARDASGNFIASTITAALNGNATSANKVNNVLSAGTHITLTAFDGSANRTISTDATNVNTGSTIVARDANGDFTAGTITAALSGNATSATSATSAGYVTNALTASSFISMSSYNGSVARTISVTTDSTASANNHIVATDADGNIHAVDVIASSDERLKKDIHIIQHALKKIKQINGVYFTFKATNSQSVGVIAQNVQQVLPEVVHTNEDGYLGVSYGQIVGLLIEGIKDLSVKFEQYKHTTNMRLKKIQKRTRKTLKIKFKHI